jgi:hypothetical protein
MKSVMKAKEQPTREDLVHRTVSSLHYAAGLSVALSAWDGLPDTAWWLR